MLSRADAKGGESERLFDAPGDEQVTTRKNDAAYFELDEVLGSGSDDGSSEDEKPSRGKAAGRYERV